MTPISSKPGVIKDPALAALFVNKDPDTRYDDLREIGHGSFGAVFFAFDRENSETVAIKKMTYNGSQAQEKWTDILKELVMEYCIGSAADIVDVLRKGLREVEIAVITRQTLEALHYLHNMCRIHRDIKAGNILLSDQAVVKLADFGSASMSDPAHTFIGTPFFMAPEVILAMDDGSYNYKSDIWSLGITCIELAERRPPLFNMNTMSALYHIAQNEPPTLAPVPEGQNQWSTSFVSFVADCLKKECEQRASTAECMKHNFITAARPRDTIQELINRTKGVVMELDNFQYKKMRKLMYLDEAEGRDSESASCSNDHDGSDELHPSIDGLSTDRDNNSASSRSASMKSLTSFRSMQSSQGPNGNNRRPPIPASMRKDSTEQARTVIPVGDTSLDSEKEPEISRPSSPVPPVRIERNIKDDMATLRKSKFSTLRSAKLISKEQEEYTKENNMYDQMSGYKRLRQHHHKELQQLEERCGIDFEVLRVRLDKELDQLQTNYGKERQRVKLAHQTELDKKRKEVEDGGKKLRKQIMTRQQREFTAYCAMQLKEYKYKKEEGKSLLKERNLPRHNYEAAVRELKNKLTRDKQISETTFDGKLKAELDVEMIRYKRSQLIRQHSLEEKLEDEELNIQERQMETRQALLLKHHEITKEGELSQQAEIHALKKRHQEIQHDAESANQNEYTRRQTDELRKRHALQNRQQPRELKLKEAQIRKQYRQAVKTQTRQFKLWQTQMMEAAPKDEQKELASKMKEEQKRKIALLASQYDNQVDSMVQEKTVKLESWQEDEAKHVAERLAKELDQLKSYQARQTHQLETSIAKERHALAERCAVRYALLQQKFDDERQELAKIRHARRTALVDRQQRERRPLDEAAEAYTTSL